MTPAKREIEQTWDELIERLDAIRDEGGVVVLKWDGERYQDKHTVLLTNSRLGIDMCRCDADDLREAIAQAIDRYIEQGGLR